MFELMDSERYPAHYQTLENIRVEQLFNTWQQHATQPLSVLDYGMGRGKYLELFRSLGMQVTGVDINPSYIAEAQERGFEALHESELEGLQRSFDIIYLSHLIEHLDPEQLMVVLDKLISLLSANGRLVIISPTLGERFFFDFSHIRPYYPQSIRHAFGQSSSPLSFGATEQVVLNDIYFFKDPVRTRKWRSFYITTSRLHPLTRTLNKAFDLAWRATGGHAGITSSWLGVYQKP